MTHRKLTLAFGALCCALLAALPARAALLEMIVTGTFDADPFGGPAASYTNGQTSIDLTGQSFTMTATFDSTTGTQVGQSQMYPAITTMLATPLVNGGAAQTVSFATLASPFIVGIADPNEPTGLTPPDPTTLGIYIAGIGDMYFSYFWLNGEFNSATPPISDAAPAPTVFTDQTWSGFGTGDNLLLADGGILTLSYSNSDYTSSVYGTVTGVQIIGVDTPAPEPASLALLAAGLAGLGLARRRVR